MHTRERAVCTSYSELALIRDVLASEENNAYIAYSQEFFSNGALLLGGSWGALLSPDPEWLL